MKTERVTLLTSPQFKTFLGAEARRSGVSVAELVRTRCEQRPTEDEAVLAALTVELKKAVVAAKKSLKVGMDEAQTVLAELRARRSATAANGAAQAVSAHRPRRAAGKRA